MKVHHVYEKWLACFYCSCGFLISYTSIHHWQHFIRNKSLVFITIDYSMLYLFSIYLILNRAKRKKLNNWLCNHFWYFSLLLPIIVRSEVRLSPIILITMVVLIKINNGCSDTRLTRQIDFRMLDQLRIVNVICWISCYLDCPIY